MCFGGCLLNIYYKNGRKMFVRHHSSWYPVLWMLFVNTRFLFWFLFIRKCNYKQCIGFKVVAVVEWCRKVFSFSVSSSVFQYRLQFFSIVFSFSVSSLSFKTGAEEELIKPTFMKYFLVFIDINLDAQKVFQMIPKQ